MAAGETQSVSLSDFAASLGDVDTGIPADDGPEIPEVDEDEAPAEPTDGDEQAQETDVHEGTDEPESEPEGEGEDDDLLDEEPAAAADSELAAKWRQLEETGELPDELLDKLVTAKNGDRAHKVTVREALANYQRLNEHTRRSQELDTRTAQLQSNERAMGEFFERIKQPEAFIETFERQLGPEVFDQVVQMRMDRMKQDGEFIEAAGFAAMRRYGVDHTDPRVADAMRAAKGRLDAERARDIEMRQLAAQKRQLEQQTQQSDQSQRVEQVRGRLQRQLEQLTPTALKANRIRDNARNREALLGNIKVLMRQRGASEITRELILEAGRIVREDLEDARAERSASKAAEKPAKQPGRKGAGGGGAPTRGKTQNDRSRPRTLAEFDAMLRGD